MEFISLHASRRANAQSCVIVGLLTILAGPVEASDAGYSLKVEGHAIGTGKVELDINTNIPGTIEVMANIGLRNQKGNDLYVGTDNEKVVLKQGAGKAIFDVSKLPRGKYEAEVGFYPDWGFKDAASRASGIRKDIEVNQPIEFAIRSSVSASQEIERKQQKEWAINHALPDAPWKASMWRERLGNFTIQAVTDDGWDSTTVQDYYFGSIDMRVRVNSRLHKILTLEDGRGSKSAAPPSFRPKPIDRGLMTDFEPVVEDAVRRNLTGPDDAKFDGLFGKLTGERSAVICGGVNARNGFGGYVGTRNFVSFVSWGESGVLGGASAALVFADGTAAFRKLWKECQ